jgi:hypothetical protein
MTFFQIIKILSALNVIAPILGIIGGSLAFFFGIPGLVYAKCRPHVISAEQPAIKYNRWGHIGAVLIIAGFVCQLLIGILKFEAFFV